MKKCVFAGTFDPLQKGHEYVIEKSLQIFDKVIVAVGVNVSKTPYFTLEERIEIIKSAFEGDDRVEVESFDGLLVDFIKEKGITVSVRGIRDQKDYEYETTMANYNADLYPQLTTLYIPTPARFSYVSSTGVRNIIELNSDFSEYIPKKALDKVKEILIKK